MLDFANYIAKNLEKDYPEVIVTTFAYRYTQRPPTGIKGHKNVSILYCTLNRDQTRPLADPSRKHNADIADDLNKWSKIVKQIDIWDYAATFASYFSPMPNLRVLPEDIKFLRDRNVHMLMIQANVLNPWNPEDFHALRTYLWGKALWNPDLDVNQTIREFVEGYYGKAAPAVMEYLAFRDKVHKKINKIYPCFTQNAPWISDKDIIKSLEYIAKAEAMADSDLVRYRLESLRKVMEYMKIARWESLLAKKMITKEELMKISGQMHVMLNSPLTAFIKPGILTEYRKKVSAFDSKYVITWQKRTRIPENIITVQLNARQKHNNCKNAQYKREI